MDKVYGKIKHLSEDFIVEERAEKWDCKVRDEFSGGVDFNLDESVEAKDFLWCEMEKKEIDHFQAIRDVALNLGVNPGDVGYAGSKDKIAWTSQRISVFKPDLEKVKNFSHPNIFLKNFKWAKRKIRMGFLDGNFFRIVVRDVEKKDAIKVGGEIRKRDWFANYFGVQRFGSIRGNNVKIGKLILKRKFEEAIWAILTDFSEKERPDISHARKKLKNEKNFKAALRYFPRGLRLERQIMLHLVRKPGDFVGAIRYSDRKNVLMFVSAVQSKIFNDVLERALEEGLDFRQKGMESCLLMGYKSRFYDGFLGDIEREVLAANDLELNDFDVREIPWLRIKGSYRKAIIEANELDIEIGDDECFEGMKKICLKFYLPSGVYATTFLDNYFEFG
jgi:tRNA pseudouridine13 synthase